MSGSEMTEYIFSRSSSDITFFGIFLHLLASTVVILFGSELLYSYSESLCSSISYFRYKKPSKFL